MPTCRDIIRRALQQARIVALGRDPAAKEAEAGMEALLGLYEGWFAAGMFGRLTDTEQSGVYEASIGDRVIGASSLTLPTSINDSGTERPPYEMAAIVDVTNGNNWLWTNGAWVDCAALTLNDDAPLAGRDREGLSSLVATYLAEGYGQEVGQMTAKRGGQFQLALSLKYGSNQAPRTAEYF